MQVLSVDLGTSNTVAVVSAHGRPPTVLELDGSATMPSAVFATPDGSLVVGREAVRRARTDPARFEPNPKRRIDEGTLLLGDRVVPVTDALAAVLHRVNAEVARVLGGAVPDEVRLTHPAQWGPLRRNVLLSAARQAGMPPNLMLIPEPVAAAAHFASFPGQSLPPGKALVVYDLGAGTFDVGVVAVQQQGFAVLGEAGLPDLGGVDIDHALLTHIGHQVAGRDPAAWHRLLRSETGDDRRAVRLLHEDIRTAKEALSAHPQTEVALPRPFGDALVTRAELEAVIRPKLAQSVQLLAATMNAAGLTPANLAGVYLVGGSSRIPLVATMITELLGVVPTSLDAPETAVALGAHLLPRAGGSLRTDTVPPPPPPSQPIPRQGPPQQGPPQLPPWQQPKPEPAPRKKNRLVLIALLAVLVLAGGAVAYFALQPGAPTGPKYDVAKLPTRCGSLPNPLPGSTMHNPSTFDSESGRLLSCEFWTNDGSGGPSEDVTVEFNVYQATRRATPESGAKTGFDDRVQGAHGKSGPIDLGYGESAAHIDDVPGVVHLMVLDGNMTVQVSYHAEPAGSKSADESLRNAKTIMKRAWDSIQPK